MSNYVENVIVRLVQSNVEFIVAGGISGRNGEAIYLLNYFFLLPPVKMTMPASSGSRFRRFAVAP